jgi:hypothetical protein
LRRARADHVRDRVHVSVAHDRRLDLPADGDVTDQCASGVSVVAG